MRAKGKNQAVFDFRGQKTGFWGYLSLVKSKKLEIFGFR